MIKLFWPRLSLALWILLAFLLPWQTKLILRPAESNYWEISLFIVMPVLVLALLASFLINYRNLNKKSFSKETILMFGLLLLNFALSVFVSLDPILSGYRYISLFLFLLAFLFFRYLKKDWQVYIFIALLVALFLQALLGIAQFFTQISFASTFLGMSAHFPSVAGTAVIETESGRWLRAYGALDHPNIFGGLMALASLSSAYLWLKIRKRYLALVLLIFYSVFNLALLASFSRAAILAFVLGFFILMIEQKKFFRLYVPLAAVSLLITIGFTWQYQDLLLTRLKAESRLERISLEERSSFNKEAWYIWKKHPLFGVGLSNSTLWQKTKQEQINFKQSAWSYQPAHNYWLLSLAEGGVFLTGVLLFVWFFIYKKSRAYRILGLYVALFILTLFDHWLFSSSLGLLLPFFWLALI